MYHDIGDRRFLQAVEVLPKEIGDALEYRHSTLGKVLGLVLLCLAPIVFITPLVLSYLGIDGIPLMYFWAFCPFMAAIGAYLLLMKWRYDQVRERVFVDTDEWKQYFAATDEAWFEVVIYPELRHYLERTRFDKDVWEQLTEAFTMVRDNERSAQVDCLTATPLGIIELQAEVDSNLIWVGQNMARNLLAWGTGLEYKGHFEKYEKLSKTKFERSLKALRERQVLEEQLITQYIGPPER